MTIARVEFQNSNYIYENGKLYRITPNGKFEDRLHCVKRIGKFKLCAELFNCALPYTIYYIIDTKSGKVYESEECHFSYIKEISEELKYIIKVVEC